MTKENAAPLSEKEIQEIEELRRRMPSGPYETVRDDYGDEDFVWMDAEIKNQTRMIVSRDGGLAPTDGAYSSDEVDATALFFAKSPEFVDKAIATIRDLQAANEQKELRIRELDKRLHEIATDERFRRLREELTLSSHRLGPTGTPEQPR